MDNLNFKEEGFADDNFFQSKTQELEYQCRIVEGVVKRKVFNLEEALGAYEVSYEAYQNYVVGNLYKKLQETLPADSIKTSTLHHLKAAYQLLHLMFTDINNEDIESIYLILNRFTSDIEREKVILQEH